MIIDLKHNKIIESTVTEAFIGSFEKNLAPKLIGKYGEGITAVQMYEDHIADWGVVGGEFYYPLTVVKGDGPFTQWIKWRVGKNDFDSKSPYAFLGKNLEFELCDKAPVGYEEKLSGRAIYCEGGLAKVKIETTAKDVTFLSGRYSQTFVDELARQLTVAIEDAMSVKGIPESSLELCLVFSPESYMEHTSENVTYRRLLITDNCGAPKDFWIKWTRLDGVTGYNVAANVNSDNILFEIGEDVSQKIREKEYRFLLNTKGKDKYHNAMGRKNITEWREVVKRLVKRGELCKVEAELLISKETEELTKSLESYLKENAPKSVGEEVVASPESDEELLRGLEFAKARLDLEESESEAGPEDAAEETEEEEATLIDLEAFYADEPADEQKTAEEDSDEDDAEDLAREAREAVAALRATEVSFGEEEADEPAEEVDEEIDEATDGSDAVVLTKTIVPEDPCKEEYSESEYSEIEDEEALEEQESEELTTELALLDGTEEEESQAKPASNTPAVSAFDVTDLEAKIRAELEAKLRLEYEIDARKRAESEAERLRIENEKLLAMQKKQEELKEERERARAEETERLRSQIEAQLRAESRERERLAEAARAAVEEKRRIEEEKARLEQIRLEDERRAEAEREARELELRRAAEVERITRETEARIRAEYEAKRAEEESARASMPEPEAPIRVVEEKPVPREDEINRNYTYTSKNVRLLFRRSVDPNITARIHEIIKATLDYYGKSKVYLKIKATVPDNQTVVLEFIKIPMEEMELLGNMIKVLGNSGLGIAKAIVE